MAQLKIGQYLFTRIKQLGVQTVFGVPGGEHFPLLSSRSITYLETSVDYELVILDMVPDVGLTWRGNPNELIAGYAVSLTRLLFGPTLTSCSFTHHKSRLMDTHA